MKLKHILSVVLVASFLATGCSEYNNATAEDKNGNSERIYGEKGAPPKQMANKYESNPKSAERARDIREKLYPAK